VETFFLNEFHTCFHCLINFGIIDQAKLEGTIGLRVKRQLTRKTTQTRNYEYARHYFKCKHVYGIRGYVSSLNHENSFILFVFKKWACGRRVATKVSSTEKMKVKT